MALRQELLQTTRRTRFWDNAAAALYLYNAEKKTFITYNDAEAETARTAYVKKHHLGGIMFWEYTGDRATRCSTPSMQARHCGQVSAEEEVYITPVRPGPFVPERFCP